MQLRQTSGYFSLSVVSPSPSQYGSYDPRFVTQWVRARIPNRFLFENRTCEGGETRQNTEDWQTLAEEIGAEKYFFVFGHLRCLVTIGPECNFAKECGRRDIGRDNRISLTKSGRIYRGRPGAVDNKGF
ncbi:hypothetical protein TNCV_3416671 [Trichonephila clavipes]|nr:hypothetical protein TNCV_3416671 [Trichonephila clavipes]